MIEPLTGKPLSEREKQILEAVAEGLSNSQIGRKLYLSPHTVKTHLRRISQKSGLGDRAAMVAWAMRRNLIS